MEQKDYLQLKQRLMKTVVGGTALFLRDERKFYTVESKIFPKQKKITFSAGKEKKQEAK